jgi:adenosylmethionine---8-amino-7-oxononanoate aminotransferase
MPDLICLSKGFTGGFLPLAATVCRREIYDALPRRQFRARLRARPLLHRQPARLRRSAGIARPSAGAGTTARFAVIESVHRERLARTANHPGLTRGRVCGTIAAVTVGGAEQAYSAALGSRLRAFFLERGLLVHPLGSVVYLLPPYCVSSQNCTAPMTRSKRPRQQ